MGKALKVVALGALIVGAGVLTFGGGGAAIGGLLGSTSLAAAAGSAISATIASTSFSLGMAGLQKNFARRPGMSLPDLGRLNLSQTASAPRRAVFGPTALAADLRYTEPSGDQQRYVDAIVHLASHKITSLDSIYISDELAWTAAGGAQGIYAGFFTVEIIPEAGPAAYHTVNGGAKWGPAQRMTGCATLKLRLDRKEQNKKQSPFVNGLPTNIRFVGRGMPVYDPRRDGTVPGGFGPMRANDCTTWRYSDGATDLGGNHALQALSWLLGWRIMGQVSVGLGLPPERLDLETFAQSANACDEAIALEGGGTQRRYEGGGLFSDDADPGAVMADFAAACNGWWDDSNGRLGLFVSVNDLAGPLVHLTDDDVLGGISWVPFPDIGEQYNVVRGQNPDPQPTALFQPTDYPEVRLASADAIDRALTQNLGLVQNKRRAQRIAKQVLQRQQYRGLLSLTVGVRGWQLMRGQPLRLSLRTFGWAEKLFRVETWRVNLDASVDLVLHEENAAIYAWDREEKAAVQPAEPVVYDPRNAPGATDGAPGAGAYQLVLGGGYVLDTPSTVRKTGASGWNANFRASASYSGGVFAEFTVENTADRAMIGFGTDPTLYTTAPEVYYSIIHNIYASVGTLYAESGTVNLGSVVAGDRIGISYNGKNRIDYLKNGYPIASKTATPDQIFWVKGAINDTDTRMVDIVIAGQGRAGNDGAPTFTATPTLSNWTVACASGGAPLPGALDGANGFLICGYNGVDVGPQTTFSIALRDGCDGVITAAGAYAITGISADVAKLTLRAVYDPPDGVPQQTRDVIIPVIKSERGAAALQTTDDSTTIPGFSDTVLVGPFVMIAGPGGSVQLSANSSFIGMGSGSSAYVYIKAQSRLAGTTDPWVDVNAYVGGNPTYWDPVDMAWYGGNTSFAISVAGPAGQQIREYRLIGRKDGANISPPSMRNRFTVARTA